MHKNRNLSNGEYIELKKELLLEEINFPKFNKQSKPLAFLFEKIDNKKYIII